MESAAELQDCYFPVPPLLEPGLPELHPPDVPEPLVPEFAPPVVPLDEPDPEFMPPLELAPPCPLALLFDCPEFTELELDPLDEPEKWFPLAPPCPPWFCVEPLDTLFELVPVLLPVAFP